MLKLPNEKDLGDLRGVIPEGSYIKLEKCVVFVFKIENTIGFESL